MSDGQRVWCLTFREKQRFSLQILVANSSPFSGNIWATWDLCRFSVLPDQIYFTCTGKTQTCLIDICIVTDGQRVWCFIFWEKQLTLQMFILQKLSVCLLNSYKLFLNFYYKVHSARLHVFVYGVLPPSINSSSRPSFYPECWLGGCYVLAEASPWAGLSK